MSEEYGRISIQFSHEDQDHWRIIKDSLKRYVSGVRFDGGTKNWICSSSHRGDVRNWVSHWYEGWQITDQCSSGSSYSNNNHSHQQQASPPNKMDQAFTVLYLLPIAPMWVAEAVHRAAVKQFHPDRGVGGDTATMARINASFDLIKEVRS